MTTSKLDDSNESFFLYGVEQTGFEVMKKPTITEDDQVIVQIKKTGYVSLNLLSIESAHAISSAYLALYYHHRICGSDVHYLCHGRIGVSTYACIVALTIINTMLAYQDFVVQDKMVLGHESAGVVVEGTSLDTVLVKDELTT
jgi:hypothetical protein